MKKVDRRKFLTSISALAAILPLSGIASGIRPEFFNSQAFSFLLLGDIHFDKFKHHAVDFMREKYPKDIRQVISYSHITWENLPDLITTTKALANKTGAEFVVQIGDFLEGLCGSKELAALQAEEFIDFLKDQKLDLPFIVTKGNHDITGPGADEVYIETILPWQQKELGQQVTSANTTFVRNNARFVMFDGYGGPESLEWFKKVLKNHKEDHLFFCVHEPVVPYNARSTWHVYNRDPQRREELVNLLGKNNAIVLGGHLHKTSIVTRNTPYGNFIQVGIGSVIPSLDAPIKNHIKGVENYNSKLVELEPDFSPSTLHKRKEILEEEAPHIRHFEYADFCGYGAVTVKDNNDIELSIFANVDKTPWTTVNLSKLRKL
jgi:3',5'-cyclic AMP phosphodiesterase CpdA